MIQVEVEDAAWTAAEPDAEALARAAAAAVFRQLDAAPSPSPGSRRDPVGEEGFAPSPLVVLLTDDASVQSLNARFRGQDKPTNVLSFPAAANPEGHLGDLALAFGVCAREAGEQGKTLAAHLQHLVAHGVLHLLGYDHITEPEATEMEDLERAVLASLGLSDPYAPAEGDHG